MHRFKAMDFLYLCSLIRPMSKLALVFHSLSLVIGIVAIWVTSSRVTKFENEQAQIRQAQEEIASKEKEMKDLQKEIASSILREKNRLQDEVDELEESKKQMSLTGIISKSLKTKFPRPKIGSPS